MSGGAFDYKQFHIRQIWEDIEYELDKQGKERSVAEIYSNFEDKYYPIYPEKVQKIMMDAIETLKKAEVYTQRVDWYLSGDDGEESLYKRLDEDLNKLKL